jgi:hypothetical protein
VGEALRRSPARRSFGSCGHGHYNKGVLMHLNLDIGPLLALMAGILILLVPRLLNYVVAVYLILIGLTGLFGIQRLW